MSLPLFAVRRPVAVTMLFAGVVLLGIVSLLRMPVSLLPDVAYPRLVVSTTVPERAPAEVERFVTERIEGAMATVPGVRSIESVSREGHSRVTVLFPWGTDMEFAQLHVRERLDEMYGAFPESAGRPTILRVDPDAEPILVGSAAPAPGNPSSLAHVQSLATTVLRRRLEQLEGVARAEAVGLGRREIQVEVDPARLESHGLTIDAVSVALARANASSPGGTIRRGAYRYALRAEGGLNGTREVAEVIVAHGPAGGTIRVADVAAVRDSVMQGESAAYFGGQPSIGLLVYKESGANTVAAARAAAGTFRELEASNPGIALEVVTSQASFVTAAIRNVVLALIFGGLLAFLVLFPFFRDLRWPMAIAVAIPISIVGAFALLDASGVSFNMMSLGGLALGVGLLVDNSIVVLENVFRHREEGIGEAAAAAAGAEEVQSAITASTLTTIAVFGPIVYVEGLAGALFGDLALAVAFSLVVSLAVALTLLPAITARFKGGAARATPVSATRSVGRMMATAMVAFERWYACLAAFYERALNWALGHRSQVLSATATAFVAALLVAVLLPRDVLPEVDEHAFAARLTLPPGTPFEETEQVALAMDTWLRARPEVAAVLTRVGRASSIESGDVQGRNSALLDVRLHKGVASARSVMSRVRTAFSGLPPEALALETGSATGIGRVLGNDEADVTVELMGAGLDTLRTVAEEVARRLRNISSLASVATTFEEGQPEARVALDRDAIARHGLAIDHVVREIIDRTRGRVATALVEFDREVPVVVRPSALDRRDLDDVLAGAVDDVPLGVLVRVAETVGPAALERKDQRRLVAVTADVVDGGLSGAVAAIEEALEDLAPASGVEVAVAGGGEELRRSLHGLGLAFLLALALVYLILAAQFESLVQPLIVLLAVPLALMGAILALALTGLGLDTMSGIGMVVLAGIAVNDAILKVDTINRERRTGLDLPAAIEEAGRARLRPILMTTATTVLGLLPLAVGLGSGSELRAPLAVAVVGGMLTSTTLTLLVVPVLYSIVAQRQA